MRMWKKSKGNPKARANTDWRDRDVLRNVEHELAVSSLEFRSKIDVCKSSE